MDNELEGRSKSEIAAELEANRAAFFPAAKEAAYQWSGRAYTDRAQSRVRGVLDRVRTKARQTATTARVTLRDNVYAVGGGVVLIGAVAGFLLRRKFRR